MHDPSKLPPLSRRERQIMDLIFQHGEMTAQEVTDQLPDAPSYTTVRTLLRVLEEKGHLIHFQSGKQYVYKSVQAPESVRKQSLQHLLKTFFGGSISAAVATFLHQSDTKLTETELQELEEMVRKAREQQ